MIHNLESSSRQWRFRKRFPVSGRLCDPQNRPGRVRTVAVRTSGSRNLPEIKPVQGTRQHSCGTTRGVPIAALPSSSWSREGGLVYFPLYVDQPPLQGTLVWNPCMEPYFTAVSPYVWSPCTLPPPCKGTRLYRALSSHFST